MTSIFAADTDGLVNLCKLADITHRINRAEEHDSHQVAHWIEHEVSRRDENTSSLTLRQERLQFLRGEDSGQLLEQSVGKLKTQINVLNDRLALAVGEEDEARKVRFVSDFCACCAVSCCEYAHLTCKLSNP
jgi:hypothetical protein